VWVELEDGEWAIGQLVAVMRTQDPEGRRYSKWDVRYDDGKVRPYISLTGLDKQVSGVQRIRFEKGQLGERVFWVNFDGVAESGRLVTLLDGVFRERVHGIYLRTGAFVEDASLAYVFYEGKDRLYSGPMVYRKPGPDLKPDGYNHAIGSVDFEGKTVQRKMRSVDSAMRDSWRYT
jgi:hypothetical protein